MNTGSSLNIPESDCWIKTGRSKNLIIEIINIVSSTNVSYQVHVGIVCPGTSGTPLDGVDLLLMSLQVVNTVVSVHGPHLESHVVTAGGQELALRIPFDSVHLISVSLKNSIFYNKKYFSLWYKTLNWRRRSNFGKKISKEIIKFWICLNGFKW